MSSFLLSLVLTSPAHALGVVVGKNGTEPTIVRVRAVVAADRPPDDLSRTGVAVVSAQVMVDANDGAWAWIVPLPAGDRTGLQRYESDDFDRIFLATSPAFEPVKQLTYTTSACGGTATPQASQSSTACGGTARDSGLDFSAPLPLGFYWSDPETPNLDRENSFRVTSEEADRVLEELEDEGFALSADVQDHLTSHTSQGGDLLVVKMYAPPVGEPGLSDVFAWKTSSHSAAIPLGSLRYQPESSVLLDLHLVGDARWAPDGVEWMAPQIPEVLLLPTEAANPYWQDVLLAAWERDALIQVFGGARDTLATRRELLGRSMEENASMYATIIDSADGVLSTFFSIVFFSPVGVFESLFTAAQREDEADDLLRNMQIDELLPSGWRRDNKTHMTYQGILDTNVSEDLGIREDSDLRFREVVIGGQGQAVTSSAWLNIGLWGFLGLGAAGLRRRSSP